MIDTAIIEKEALKLSEAERALLADKLLESISHIPQELKNSWVKEADQRMAAYRSGELEAVDGPQALDELRARFSG